MSIQSFGHHFQCPRSEVLYDYIYVSQFKCNIIMIIFISNMCEIYINVPDFGLMQDYCILVLDHEHILRWIRNSTHKIQQSRLYTSHAFVRDDNQNLIMFLSISFPGVFSDAFCLFF